jgi:sulfide:quinone oxidoreductase
VTSWRPTRVLVLGAGFGGLEVATRLCEEAADEVEVTLVDQAEGFMFGFSKLDVMFRQVPSVQVLHRYADLAKPGLTFLRSRIEAIDPIRRQVVTRDGDVEADVLVIALGADTDPHATPGLVDGGHEFYSVPGAVAAAAALDRFEGGRVVVGVTSTPFKCPPAPSETALLLHDFLVARGLRGRSQVSLVMPLGVPIPPSPAASAVVLAALRDRAIGWHPERLVRAVDGAHQQLVLDDGSELPYDLFLAVPAHRAPTVVVDAGLTEDGWIPVDPHTLRTRFADVYAVGDVTSVGTPKAGVFAEGQAAVVATQILAGLRADGAGARYDGRGVCYMEVGAGQVAKVDVTFRPGERPVGGLEGPAAALAEDKSVFGSTRVARWFGRSWPPPVGNATLVSAPPVGNGGGWQPT